MGQPDGRLERGKKAFNQVYGDGAADTFLTRRAGLGEDLPSGGVEFLERDARCRDGPGRREDVRHDPPGRADRVDFPRCLDLDHRPPSFAC